MDKVSAGWDISLCMTPQARISYCVFTVHDSSGGVLHYVFTVHDYPGQSASLCLYYTWLHGPECFTVRDSPGQGAYTVPSLYMTHQESCTTSYIGQDSYAQWVMHIAQWGVLAHRVMLRESCTVTCPSISIEK